MWVIYFLLEGFLVLGVVHFFERRKPNWILFIGSALLVEVVSVSISLLYRPLSAVGLMISLLAYAYWLLRDKIALLITIIVMVIAMIGSSVSNSMSNYITSAVFGETFNKVNNKPTIIWTISIMLCYIIFAMLVKPIYIRIKSSYSVIEPSIFKVIIVLTYVAFFALYYGVVQIADDKEIFEFNIVLTVVLISIVSVVGLLYYTGIKRMEIRANQQQLTQLSEYMDNIEEMNLEMRRFKHDYKNVLASMYTYIEDEDVKGLKRLMNEHIMPFEESIDIDMSELNKLAYLEDKELKGLISHKLTGAIHKGIHTRITINETITKLNMNMVDLCRVIGILIDNAVEEAILSEDKYVHVLLEELDSVALIHIENSLSNPNVPITAMFKKNYTTKENHSGLGLYSVQKIFNENHMTMETRIENDNIIQMFSIMK